MTLKQIEHYRLERLLGEGGMGHVFQALDLNLERRVALKVMHGHLARNAGFQQRFMQEARAAARLRHPGIVTIHHFGLSEDLLYLVMEFVEGRDLLSYARGAPLRSALERVAQVADALDFAHARGIVHRDIKPDNILVQTSLDGDPLPTPRAVVTDFGLAKLLEGEVQTRTGTVMGTLPYMSPEQCRGVALDGRSDIYALGIVLYQLATGQLPFPIRTPADAIRSHLQDPPPPPSTLQRDLPAALEQIILRCLAKRPEERHATAGELAVALRQAAANVAPGTIIMNAAPPAGDATYRLGSHEVNSGLATPALSTSTEQAEDQLLIARADGETRRVTLRDKTVVIGRDETCDVVLESSDLSRQHAKVVRQESGWAIIDLNSTNGTFLNRQRILAGVAEPWPAGKTVRLGRYFLRWLPGQQAATAGPKSYAATGVEPAGDLATSHDGQIGLIVNPTKLTLDPGQEATIQIEIMNLGNTVEKYRVAVEGIPATWTSFSNSKEQVNLMPGGQARVTATIRPPGDGSARAGAHPLTVAVRGTGSGPAPDAAAASVAGTVTIRPQTTVVADIRPRQLEKPGTVHLAVENQGNSEVELRLVGRDPAEALSFEGLEDRITVPPGEKRRIDFAVRPRRRPLTGATRRQTYGIKVLTPQGVVAAVDGQVALPPRVPLGLATGGAALLAFLCLLLTIGGGFLLQNGGLPALGLGTTATPTATVEVAGGGGGDEGTPLPTPVDTPAPTSTGAPTSPAATSTPTPSPSPTPSPTSTPTATATPSPTPTTPASGARALGAGLPDQVRALAVNDEALYAGGDFPGGIRRWDRTTQTWSDLGGGVNGRVYDVALHQGQVYLTGSFRLATNGDGSTVEVNNVAVWNGASWAALGSGVRVNPNGLSIAVDEEGTVYVGGSFQGGSGRNITRWVAAEQRWRSLGPDPEADAGVRNFGNDNPGDFVNNIVVDGEWVYVTGRFSNASHDLNNVNVPRTVNVARWNRKTMLWDSLGDGLVNNTGSSNEIFALTVYDGQVVVGGLFTGAVLENEPDQIRREADYIALFDGEEWQALPGLDFDVWAVAANDDGLYAAGDPGRDASAYGNVARWTGESWVAPGSGTGDRVQALAGDGAVLYLGGQFTTFNDVSTGYVIRWVE